MLKRALASVNAQIRPADQVIVELDDDRTGAAATRNRAFDRCDTDLVAWLDDDDELLPNHLLRLARVLERADVIDLVYPIPRIPVGRDPTAVAVNGVWQKPWGVPFGLEQQNHLINEGSFIPITHMVRSGLVREIGGFPRPGDVRWIEDWGYLVKLLNVGARFVHLPVVTWLWHIHDNHTGGDPARTGPVWEQR